ncbi:chemotaxis protein CheV [Alteromonas abrolhosensis]|jgi:two-component system chemotaxis response regulator CheV|uniref:chemotaxis protein CheV n=1 Tax=Alteromonas abrolhosensis TaxID=1892904 RepID=UPI000AA1BFF5|tara:strand:- start:178 stop:1137 length:960 start_codon:yes stop_codon:yes gene_type:complete
MSSSVLSSVDQRTKLVGENRLELLMFQLGTRHIFAMNVFKIKEVINVPKLNIMPGSHHNLKGVMNYRGSSIPIIDLRQAIKMRGAATQATAKNVIITEYNRSVQGFIIGEVKNIVNTSWGTIQPPPSGIGKSNYLTAITQVNVEGKQELVEIIDVEKVLAEIIDYDTSISEEVLDKEIVNHFLGKKVLIVDDSSTARKQIKDTLEQLGISIIERKNGAEALALLKQWADQGKNPTDEILLMFTDAEMPEMDGYRLTSEVRNDPRMSNLFIALNTSLSGSFNDAMVEKVGCDRFISKFQPDMLVDVAQQRMREYLEAQNK